MVDGSQGAFDPWFWVAKNSVGSTPLSWKLGLMCCLASASVTSAYAEGLEVNAVGEPRSVEVERVPYRGETALKVTDRLGLVRAHRLLVLPTADFRDGVITGKFAGRPTAGSSGGARGFVGVAFRVSSNRERYEAFYVRPANGRSEDQLRRNRSTQYVSEPDFPWERLRSEMPGQYESYADMAVGEWIAFRIVVSGKQAMLFLNEQDQPSLVVNDLKMGGDATGAVALWIGPETEAYFADVAVVPAQ